MNNYVSTEKSLKRWLKSRVKITMATVVGFLIAGTVTFGAMADGSYTNDTLTGEVGSTKFIKGHNGNLIINTNGSVGTLLNNLKTSLSKLKEIEKDKNATDEQKKEAVEKLIGCFGLQENGGAVVVGAVAGEGKLNAIPGTAVDLIATKVKETKENYYILQLAKGLNRINTIGAIDKKQEEKIETGSTNTIIGNKNSPVVIGLVGGDLALGTGNLLESSDAEGNSVIEKLIINKNGSSTVTINNGNVFLGSAGSSAVSLGNISASALGGAIHVEIDGSAETTINGNTNLNINGGANGAGVTAGGLAVAIGGTAVTNVNGNSNIKVNSVVNAGELAGLTVGLFGGGMAVSTLGGKAEAKTTGITNVKITDGLSVGVAGGGLAVSTDLYQFKDKFADKLADKFATGKLEPYKELLSAVAKQELEKIPEMKKGGISTVKLGNINITLSGKTAAAGVLGNGIAVSHHPNFVLFHNTHIITVAIAAYIIKYDIEKLPEPIVP